MTKSYIQIITNDDGYYQLVMTPTADPHPNVTKDSYRFPLIWDVTDDPRNVDGTADSFLFDWDDFNGQSYQSAFKTYFLYRCVAITNRLVIDLDLPINRDDKMGFYQDLIALAWDWLKAHNYGFWFGDGVIIGQDVHFNLIASGDKLSMSGTRGITDKGHYQDTVNLWFDHFIKRFDTLVITNKSNKTTATVSDYDDSDYVNGVAI